MDVYTLTVSVAQSMQRMDPSDVSGNLLRVCQPDSRTLVLVFDDRRYAVFRSDAGWDDSSIEFTAAPLDPADLHYCGLITDAQLEEQLALSKEATVEVKGVRLNPNLTYASYITGDPSTDNASFSHP